jgi:hypothetical protein
MIFNTDAATYDVSMAFTYTGDARFIGEGEGNWHIEIYDSGTLNFSKLENIDKGIEVFLCGGGAKGSKSSDASWSGYYVVKGGNGGGGGERITQTVTDITENTDYSIVVGGSGGNTTAFGLTAAAGTAGAGGAGASSGTASNGTAGSYAFNDETFVVSISEPGMYELTLGAEASSSDESLWGNSMEQFHIIKLEE